MKTKNKGVKELKGAGVASTRIAKTEPKAGEQMQATEISDVQLGPQMLEVKPRSLLLWVRRGGFRRTRSPAPNGTSGASARRILMVFRPAHKDARESHRLGFDC
jgi:hypothetical protein